MVKLTSEQKTPTDIQVDLKQRQLRITWADQHQSSYSFTDLRKICPCAECDALRQNEDPLRIFKPDQAITEGVLRSDKPVEMVGNYALQFFWQDGHNTGIYTFEFLREIGY